MRSEELILQAHQGENAPAALAMILAHYGRRVTIGELSARRLESAVDLVSAARAYGLYAQGYRMSCQELYQAPLPLIAHWRFREFVVVTAIRGGKLVIDSPAEGRMTLSGAEFEAGFTGVALCFTADARPERTAPKQARPGGLLRAFPGVSALLAVAEVFVCVCCVMMLMLVRDFAEQLVSSAENVGGGICVRMAVLLLAQAAACGFQLRLLGRCGDRLGADALRGFEDRLNRESAAFFMRTSRYRLGLVGAGCGTVPMSVAHEVFYLLQLVTAAVCMLLMATQDIFSAAAALAGAMIFAAVCVLCRDVLYSDAKLAARDRSERLEQLTRDTLEWEKLRLSGGNRTRFEAWLRQTGAAPRRTGMVRQKRIWSVFAAVEFLIVFCVCLLRTLSGTVGIPALLGCLYLTLVLVFSLAALPRLLAEWMNVRGVLEELGSVFQGETPAAERRGGPRPDAVALQKAYIRFGSGEDEILKDITFHVRRGEILVVRCEERRGRMALSRVLSGMESPAQGALYLGSAHVNELSEAEIYENITLLGYGLPLPSGTVRENISAGFQGLTDYAVVEAASDAMLHRSILMRKRGYDTPVSSLSEGERVLLEYACAFARGTPFLVANDITDVLDEETVHGLMQSLRRRGIGAVLLTDQTHLLREAEVICRIEQGKTTLLEQAEFMSWEVPGGV